LFRLADNLRDELAWFRILQLLEGVGPVTARKVLDLLMARDGEILAAWPEARDRLPALARPQADAIVAALRASGEVGDNPGLRAEQLCRPLAVLITAR